MFAGSPQIGTWYRRQDRAQAFKVVALDQEARTVDLEYFDGTLDEWPLSHWHALDLEPCEAPYDWTGAFDRSERDDPFGVESAMSPEDWQEPLEGPQDAAVRMVLEAEARAVPPAKLYTPSRTRGGRKSRR